MDHTHTQPLLPPQHTDHPSLSWVQIHWVGLDSVINSRLIPLGKGEQSYPDLLALVIAIIVTIIVALGVKNSVGFNNVLNVLNLAVWVFIMIAGFFFINGKYWAEGQFLPYGWSGVSSFLNPCGCTCCTLCLLPYDQFETWVKGNVACPITFMALSSSPFIWISSECSEEMVLFYLAVSQTFLELLCYMENDNRFEVLVTCNMPNFAYNISFNLPAMQETGILPLGWEDSLEKEMVTHSSILSWRIPWTEEPGISPWGHKESDMTERLTFTQ